MNQFSGAILGVFLICGVLSVTGAMKCVFEKSADDFIGAALHRLQCPSIIGSQEKEFCCVNSEFKSFCCNLPDFVLNVSLWLIPIIIVLLIISSIVSCICCLCCPCCFVYKRRHGRVYATEVQRPVPSSPPYQPVEQQQFLQPAATTATAPPATKAHLPPGAYPVFPQYTGTYYGTFEHNSQ